MLLPSSLRHLRENIEPKVVEVRLWVRSPIQILQGIKDRQPQITKSTSNIKDTNRLSMERPLYTCNSFKPRFLSDGISKPYPLSISLSCFQYFTVVTALEFFLFLL